MANAFDEFTLSSDGEQWFDGERWQSVPLRLRGSDNRDLEYWRANVNEEEYPALTRLLSAGGNFFGYLRSIGVSIETARELRQLAALYGEAEIVDGPETSHEPRFADADDDEYLRLGDVPPDVRQTLQSLRGLRFYRPSPSSRADRLRHVESIDGEMIDVESAENSEPPEEPA